MAVGDAQGEKLDSALMSLFDEWNIYTTIIATILFLFVIYPWVTWREPDTHPLLLARQAASSPVRQSGESAIYRSIEVPHGYPLRAGLGVKDPGTPKWSSGRNGDLRDIWRQAARGPVKDDGSPDGEKGKFVTILGTQKAVKHDLDDVTTDINVIGSYVRENNGECTAIYLSNSIELLSSIFAGAFYGYRSALIPYKLPTAVLVKHLALVKPDFLIAEAGAVEIDAVVSACPSIRHVIWVAQEGNRHMDWNVVPEGTGGKVEAVVWHELVEERKNLTSTKVLPLDKDTKEKSLATFWSTEGDVGQLVEYTSENLVAGTAALISALPRPHRIGPSDILLSTSSLTSSYPLCLTFAALFSNASIAFNSVASENADLSLAAVGVSPTILVSSAQTMHGYHNKTISQANGFVAQISRKIQEQSLDAGNMPSRNPVVRLAEIDTTLSLSKLRLLFVSHRPGAPQSPKLASNVLSDLRMLLGARIGYALTAAPVAGATAQTNIFDYRKTAGNASFGPPVSCVEILLSGDESQISQPEPSGKIFVRGPSVVNGAATLDVEGRIGGDNTLSVL